MKLTNNKSGFTLLEIIIVIIIIGVLASLALPRFFSTVEYSKGAEAMVSISAIRQSVERCYLMRNAFTNCNAFTAMDIEDPGLAPNAHFTYTFVPAPGPNSYTITATRNSRDGGTGGTIILRYNDGGSGSVTRTGTGPFQAIQ